MSLHWALFAAAAEGACQRGGRLGLALSPCCPRHAWRPTISANRQGTPSTLLLLLLLLLSATVLLGCVPCRCLCPLLLLLLLWLLQGRSHRSLHLDDLL